jgi:small conductance mechanosensitive channel
MDLNAVTATTLTLLTALAWKLAGAVVLWFAGRWLIRAALKVLGTSLGRRQIDVTLTRYLQTGLSGVLNVALIVALLGLFGVETTTFAALIAAGGIAIGVAWGGLLANFAAGAFLVLLRPFKVGDFVTAGGVTGTVDIIGLFGTTINAPDNVQTIVGNNKIFSETIQNFSANPYRRVDLTVTISHAVDHRAAIGLLKERVATIPNVLAQPAPDVDVLQFTAAGPLLCVRPYCDNNHYWQVYFETNRLIRETFDAAGYPTPAQVYAVNAGPGPALPIDLMRRAG